jgi:hypothetical protein
MSEQRYYCPACGQVAGDSLAHHIARVRRGRVAPHHMISRLAGVAPGMHRAFESVCPGGPIDPARDRAP